MKEGQTVSFPRIDQSAYANMLASCRERVKGFIFSTDSDGLQKAAQTIQSTVELAASQAPTGFQHPLINVLRTSLVLEFSADYGEKRLDFIEGVNQEFIKMAEANYQRQADLEEKTKPQIEMPQEVHSR